MQTRRDFLKITSMTAAAAATSPLLGRAQSPTQASDSPAPVSPPSTDVTGANSLRAHAAARGELPVGCAVAPAHFTEPAYASTIAAQAGILVAENAMKWGALRPAPDRFDFHDADRILAFATAHGQKMRGHNLCWHESLPSWFAATVNKDNARRYLTGHITTVAGRYAGKLHSWDVVNEAIDIKSGRPDGLRKTPWLELIGPDYIELAFRTARMADPAALLTYNDYAIEHDSPDDDAKRAQVLALVQRLQARGAPIDAVGVQSHLSATDPLPGKTFQQFVGELARMNLQVFVTEMDVDERKLEGSVADRDAVVAKIYRDYIAMMLAEPNVTAALTWGITDRYSWLNDPKHRRPDGQPQRPLPFDADYRPTPAFFALRDAIDTRPQQIAQR
jgi:endo-1,4-beta-xylanase